MDISIVIPFYNERASLKTLCQELESALAQAGEYEIVFVNDGSTDGGEKVIRELARDNERISLFSLRKNKGKSMALNIGFKNTRGDIVLTLDADLQDDPAEIPRFLELINQGYDLVCGWKKQRKDSLEKRLASKIFNMVVCFSSSLHLKDFNCGFKAYRKNVLKNLHLYGEMHRFIPILVDDFGFKITEIAVNHRPRNSGRSKYGMKRYLRGMFDFLSVFLLCRYSVSPFYLMGKLFLIFSFFGLLLVGYSGVMKFGYGQTGVRPALFVGIFFLIAALQLIMTGFVAELLVKINRGNQDNDEAYLDEDEECRK